MKSITYKIKKDDLTTFLFVEITKNGTTTKHDFSTITSEFEKYLSQEDSTYFMNLIYDLFHEIMILETIYYTPNYMHSIYNLINNMISNYNKEFKRLYDLKDKYPHEFLNEENEGVVLFEFTDWYEDFEITIGHFYEESYIEITRGDCFNYYSFINGKVNIVRNADYDFKQEFWEELREDKQIKSYDFLDIFKRQIMDMDYITIENFLSIIIKTNNEYETYFLPKTKDYLTDFTEINTHRFFYNIYRKLKRNLNFLDIKNDYETKINFLNEIFDFLNEIFQKKIKNKEQKIEQLKNRYNTIRKEETLTEQEYIDILYD